MTFIGQFAFYDHSFKYIYDCYLRDNVEQHLVSGCNYTPNLV